MFVETFLLFTSGDQEEVQDEEQDDQEYTSGSEMIQVAEEAKKRRIPFLLLDQPLSLTMAHVMGHWKEIPFALWSTWKHRKRQNRKEEDECTESTSALRHLEQFPGLFDAIVTTRDQEMVQKLLEYCRTHHNQRIVAIVGLAHLPGIIQLWDSQVLQSAVVLDET